MGHEKVLLPVVIENTNVVDKAFDFSENIVKDFLEHSFWPKGTVCKAHGDMQVLILPEWCDNHTVPRTLIIELVSVETKGQIDLC